jgi:hypothetical protein
MTAGSGGTAPASGGAPAAGGASSGGSGASGAPGSGGAPSTPSGGRGPDGRIVVECQGFPLDGLKYSPGTGPLPNKCAPFDATLNNPYAVRCIDAMPFFKTGYPGDNLCILPPPPDKGIQVGLHPQGKAYWEQIWAGNMSGYDNPATDWVIPPGGEKTQNYLTYVELPEAHNYYRTYFRMRTGSHHNIITMHRQGAAEGWKATNGDALPGLFDPASGQLIGVLGGQQRPDDGTPASLDKPPEDEGLYLSFPANPALLYNMHHFNVTDGPILREGWSNLWWESDARVLGSWYMGMAADQISMAVQPETVVDYHYSWTIGGSNPVRLLRVFGHRHFWTTNFTSWIQRSGQTEPEVIYQSFDWEDMPTYRYDSVVKNPVSSVDTHADGAVSGIVTLKPGDQLHFNCHIDYTAKRAADDDSAPQPNTQGTLRFSNHAFSGEMCIQYGNVTGASIGTPTRNRAAVPEAAKK